MHFEALASVASNLLSIHVDVDLLHFFVVLEKGRDLRSFELLALELLQTSKELQTVEVMQLHKGVFGHFDVQVVECLLGETTPEGKSTHVDRSIDPS